MKRKNTILKTSTKNTDISTKKNKITSSRYISVIDKASVSPQRQQKIHKYFDNQSNSVELVEYKKRQQPLNHKNLRDLFNRNYYKQLVSRKPSIDKVLNCKSIRSHKNSIQHYISPQKAYQRKQNYGYQYHNNDKYYHKNSQNINKYDSKLEYIKTPQNIVQQNKSQILKLQTQLNNLQKQKQTLETQNKNLKKQLQTIKSQQNTHKYKISPQQIDQLFTDFQQKCQQQYRLINRNIDQMSYRQNQHQNKINRIMFERQLKISDNFKKSNQICYAMKPIIGDTDSPIISRKSSHKNIIKSNNKDKQKELLNFIGHTQSSCNYMHQQLQNCNIDNFKLLRSQLQDFIMKEQLHKLVIKRLHYLQNQIQEIIGLGQNRELQRKYNNYRQNNSYQQQQFVKFQNHLKYKFGRNQSKIDKKTIEYIDQEYVQELGALNWINIVNKVCINTISGLQDLTQNISQRTNIIIDNINQ